jgi:preprotein translocase subunit SecE
MADKFKFALAVLLLVAGVAGFYLLAEQAMILRVLAVMAGTGLAVAVAWQTEQGRRFFSFAKESTPKRKRSSGRRARKPCRPRVWSSPSWW